MENLSIINVLSLIILNNTDHKVLLMTFNCLSKLLTYKSTYQLVKNKFEIVESIFSKIRSITNPELLISMLKVIYHFMNNNVYQFILFHRIPSTIESICSLFLLNNHEISDYASKVLRTITGDTQ